MSGGGITSFNQEQQAAIDARDRSVLVTAGAGSGKTGVLVECVVRSIVDDGLDPRSILAVTFTNRAAAEMKNRIRVRMAELLVERHGEDAQLPAHDPVVETIDAYCNRLLAASALELGLDPAFSLLAKGAETGLFHQRAIDAALGRMLDSDDCDDALDLLERVWNVRALLIGIHDRLLTAGAPELKLPEISEARITEALERRLDSLREAGVRLKAAIEAQLDSGANSSKSVDKVLDALAQLPLLDSASVTAEDLPKLSSGQSTALKVDEMDAYAEARLAVLASIAEREMLPRYRTAAKLFDLYTEILAERKRAEGILTFADVELAAVERLEREAEVGSAPRFARVFVDEFQDVNRLQQRLIELVSGDSYYAVGDAAQAIYGFRGADVSLIRERERRLRPDDRVLELRTNYRSVAGVLEVNNVVHGGLGVEGFSPLLVGSSQATPADPVELHVVDCEHEDASASAKADLERAVVAMRIKALDDAGEIASYSDVAVLARSRGVLPGIADALRAIGIPAVVEGGGGLWSRPEVDDVVSLLAAVGNPNDEPRLLRVLRSPIAGLSVDALVLLARRARAERSSIQAVMLDPTDLPLSDRDRTALGWFVPWFQAQRGLAGRRLLSDAIEAALVETGFDLHLLGLVEGERRLANIRAMQRFADSWEAVNGSDPRAFADEINALASVQASDDDQEAVVEQDGDSKGAVRLLTMHGSKGLQFDTVIIPALGAQHQSDRDQLRVSSDGSRALMTTKSDRDGTHILFDSELAEQSDEAERQERARLLYVATTRAERRLVLVATARIRKEDGALVGPEGGRSYLAESHGHVAPTLHSRFGAKQDDESEEDPEHEWVEELLDSAKVKVVVDRGGALSLFAEHAPEAPPATEPAEPVRRPGALDPPPTPVSPASFSYTGLQTAANCSYRWYAETVIGMPPAFEPEAGGKPTEDLSPRVRGTVMHSLLENQVFGADNPSEQDALAAAGRDQEKLEADQAAEVVAVTAAILASASWRRLEALASVEPRSVRREESFSLLVDCGGHGKIPLRGVFDVLAHEGEGRVLVIDWKTSTGAAGSSDLEALVAADYSIQREAYALAALASGGKDARPESVEVTHVYAERPDEPVVTRWTQADVPRLAESLAGRIASLLDGNIAPTATPSPVICRGCPARRSICSRSEDEIAAGRALQG